MFFFVNAEDQFALRALNRPYATSAQSRPILAGIKVLVSNGLTATAPIIMITNPTAASGVSHGLIFVNHGTTRPIPPRISQTPIK